MSRKSLLPTFASFFISVIFLAILSGCSTTTVTATQSTSSPLNTTLSTVSNTQNTIVNLPSFAALLNVAEHSVVKIDVTGTGTDIFGRTVQQQGAGSGWIMNANGSIVTNNHVIDGANSITVTILDGKTFTAQVVNADPVNDLALLRIDGSQMPILQIGDASKLQVGDWVLAIGNPLGEGIIATEGIVSRLGVNLSVSSTETYNNLIETTAAINPGNSGGPLINLSGEVVGITTAKVSSAGIEGMGYAISMVDALPVIQKLTSAK